MAHYRYKVIDENGKYVSGRLAADNPADLATLLREKGFDLVSYKENSNTSFSFLGGIQTKDIIAVFVHLEQLERAGVSIVDSIADLRDTADTPAIKDLMHELHESIKKGNMLSDSLAKRTDVFNPVHVGLITMGEKTGNLADSFASIVDDLKWSMDIKRKTKKAFIGPTFGIIMMLIVIGVMTTVVVPKVTSFIIMQGMELPTITKALIAFSNFFQNYWMLIIFFIPVFWISVKVFSRIENVALVIDDFKIKLPVFGPIINKIDSAKFCQFFSMTFKSGLGVIECLEASGSVIKNRAIRHSIEQVKQDVSDGKSLADSLMNTRYFPNLVIRMFKIGEESGNMESALANVKFFYDREINDSIDRLVGMIQPTLTIVMGGMIGWIVVAVFGPIYSSFSNIQ